MKQKSLLVAALCISLLTLSACALKDTGSGSIYDFKTDDQTESMNKKEGMSMKKSKTMSQDRYTPEFKMQNLKGQTVKLSDYAGKKLYIKFWASWCPVCLGGLKDLNALSAENKSFEVLTIVTPGHKGEKDTKSFKKWFASLEDTKNISVLLDKNGTYTAEMGIRGFPTSVYIDSAGKLVKFAPGHADNDTIKSAFKTIH